MLRAVVYEMSVHPHPPPLKIGEAWNSWVGGRRKNVPLTAFGIKNEFSASSAFYPRTRDRLLFKRANAEHLLFKKGTHWCLPVMTLRLFIKYSFIRRRLIEARIGALGGGYICLIAGATLTFHQTLQRSLEVDLSIGLTICLERYTKTNSYKGNEAHKEKSRIQSSTQCTGMDFRVS